MGSGASRSIHVVDVTSQDDRVTGGGVFDEQTDHADGGRGADIADAAEAVAERRAGSGVDGDGLRDQHAGESETSHTMISRPDLVHLDRANSESGADQNRLDLPSNVYTGIWWYAKFPDHFAGNPADASRELGQFEMNAWASQIANAIRAIKADEVSPRLQREFFEKSGHPVATKQ